MEILSPASYLSSYNWLLEESRSSTKWTPAENKTFENALAVHDRDTPDRWQKVAALIPGKTVRDVMKQYKELEDDVSSIEAGLVPIPGYRSNSPFTLDWGNTTHGFVEGFRQPYGGGGGGRRSSVGRNSEHERKKGVPWTEEEHKLFLMGLKKYGKGDWRNISRNFVITRTPTQVASHAQKYFIRQLSGGKDKRRASIHDITTLNLNDNHQTPSPDTQRPISPPERSSSAPIPRTDFQWNQLNVGAEMAVHPTHGNLFISPNCGIDSYGMKMQAESMRRIAMPRGAYGGVENMVFQMESVGRYPHG